MSHIELEISPHKPNFINEPNNRMKDTHDFQNVLKLVYLYPRNAGKTFKKDISFTTGDMPIMASFQ